MNEITEDEWLQICGLITLAREFRKQANSIDSIVEQKFSFIDGYFSDEVWDDLSLTTIRKKWLGNKLINMKITKETNGENKK